MKSKRTATQAHSDSEEAPSDVTSAINGCAGGTDQLRPIDVSAQPRFVRAHTPPAGVGPDVARSGLRCWGDELPARRMGPTPVSLRTWASPREGGARGHRGLVRGRIGHESHRRDRHEPRRLGRTLRGHRDESPDRLKRRLLALPDDTPFLVCDSGVELIASAPTALLAVAAHQCLAEGFLAGLWQLDQVSNAFRLGDQ